MAIQLGCGGLCGGGFAKATLVGGEGFFGVALDAGDERGGWAELIGGDLAEQEPVMPFAAGFLQRLEFGSEAMGAGCGFGGRFGKVAGQLGLLANVVQAGGVGEIASGGCVAIGADCGVGGVPVLDEGDEARLGKGDGLGCGEGVEKFGEGFGQVALVLVQE